MSIDLKVPPVGESITEVFIGEWLVKEGQWVAEDEPLVVVESDKVNMEVPAPVSGVITRIIKPSGEDATIGEVIGQMEAAAKPEGQGAAAQPVAQPEVSAPAAVEAAGDAARVSPAARRMLAEHGLNEAAVKASGPGGRLLKEDVQRHLERKQTLEVVAPAPAAPRGPRETERKRMSPMRKTVARRLVEAQQSAALLTTFNEIDMSAVMALRSQFKDAFAEKHGTKLGFMSFFVRAVVEALKAFPAVNAQIDGQEMVYHHYHDIGVAIGGGRGLVVPVLRNAEQMNFAQIEATIRDFGARAKKNKIKLDELQGGTFSITNGGVYGSLLSTPIINPPQSGILGMHGIKQRPIAVNGEVVIRPMMYVALTYDHRIVDGREAVSFLNVIKDCIEAPARMLLEV